MKICCVPWITQARNTQALIGAPPVKELVHSMTAISIENVNLTIIAKVERKEYRATSRCCCVQTSGHIPHAVSSTPRTQKRCHANKNKRKPINRKRSRKHVQRLEFSVKPPPNTSHCHVNASNNIQLLRGLTLTTCQ